MMVVQWSDYYVRFASLACVKSYSLVLTSWLLNQLSNDVSGHTVWSYPATIDVVTTKKTTDLTNLDVIIYLTITTSTTTTTTTTSVTVATGCNLIYVG